MSDISVITEPIYFIFSEQKFRKKCPIILCKNEVRSVYRGFRNWKTGSKNRFFEHISALYEPILLNSNSKILESISDRLTYILYMSVIGGLHKRHFNRHTDGRTDGHGPIVIASYKDSENINFFALRRKLWKLQTE